MICQMVADLLLQCRGSSEARVVCFAVPQRGLTAVSSGFALILRRASVVINYSTLKSPYLTCTNIAGVGLG